MKLRWLILALVSIPLGVHAQSAQFGPYAFSASASGVPSGPSGFPVKYPPQVDTLGLTVTGVNTTTTWTLVLATSPDQVTWTTCETITLSAGTTTTATCSPQGGAYVRVTVTAGTGGGSVQGSVFGQNSKIGSIGGGGGGATFPSSSGVVCNTSTTASQNCNASQITTALGYTPTQTIANGTATLGTSAIASGACASVVTVASTGVLTTDNISADFNSDPTSTLGYEPGAMLTIVKYPTAGDVNFKVCNNTGSSNTPGAVTLNWRVTR